MAGFTVGGGVEPRWRKFKIAPAIRYTRWAGSSGGLTQPNQVEFLAGFLL